jgi:hypothetical protein
MISSRLNRALNDLALLRDFSDRHWRQPGADQTSWLR